MCVLAIFSLILSLIFYLYHAPDVAIAEAAVGAGVAELDVPRRFARFDAGGQRHEEGGETDNDVHAGFSGGGND